MAPVDKKRKSGPTNESFARSRQSIDGDRRPPKRQRPEETNGGHDAPKIAPVPRVSKLQKEEAAFPRGGASVLTPLEHKQIQIDATRDVLFEQQGSKANSTKQEGDSSAEPGLRIQKKPKPKAKGKTAAKVEDSVEETIKIEGLSYKRIVPGSLVLGQVSKINDHDIALSLPNNLTGYVPIVSISEIITQRLENIVTAEESDNDVVSGNLAEDVDLKRLFAIGQYLRAYVVSTSDEPETIKSGKPKRRIELSLRPQQANNSLTLQNIIINTTVMAFVVSVEDHGLVMDLGLLDTSIRGFMSSKEIGHGVDVSTIEEGAVFLCTVIGLSSNGKTVKLCADPQKMGNLKKGGFLSEAPTVEAFLPGSAVEILVADITARGLIGKVMGMVDVTADLMHSGAGASGKDMEKKYKIGSKIKARLICTFPNSEPRKLGVSVLDHILSFAPHQVFKDGEKHNPLEVLPLSSIVEEAKVRKVEDGIGLFVNVGVKGVPGFVHISRVKDGKIETLSEHSGPFKLDSTHRARIIGYNSMDGVYLVSLEASILEQPFLRIEDIKIGEVVKGKVEKIILNAKGVGGILVNLAEGISGLVPESHLADVQLLHPEKKFKEGLTVTARVLSTDPSKRKIRLTLKKSLVNSEAKLFLTYDDILAGMQSPGTIVNIIPSGAVVQFYGSVRGFLPVAEMSEAYIQDPNQHFRVGQVVNVHVQKINAAEKKLVVSCKDPSAFGLAQQTALKNLKIGEILSAIVSEKSADDISVELLDVGLRAKLPVWQLSDGSSQKNQSTFKKIRVGQTLTDLAVLEKVESKRLIILTNKPSLVKDARERTLLRSFEDVKENKIVHGFVKNITATAVFVQFGGGLTGLLPKSKMSEKAQREADFGFRQHQTIELRVFSVDHIQRQFLLSTTNASPKQDNAQTSAIEHAAVNVPAASPVDECIESIDDLTLGKVTKARISSVKETQLNVQLADNIQGRVDVSQVFDSWDDIKDRKQPLRAFSPKQVINVRVLGIHDARNHRFLPITHRAGKSLVFELSAKPSDQTEAAGGPLTLDQIEVGSFWVVYVNNIGDDWLWVNLSPNVRGRIRALDVSDDVSLLKDLKSNFPVGSAIRAYVTNVDAASNRLDLSARSSTSESALSFKNISKGAVLPGKVTKVNERHVMIQISESVSGPIHLTDLADDFSASDPTKYSKNEIIRVCVVDIDAPNKKIRLSTRPSRVLNSSLPVQDVELSSISQLKVNDIVRGFVKHISDKGLFVNLGGNLTAFARISDLSDSYVRDWKSEFEVDKLVKGKITAIDANLNHIQFSLKPSVIDKDYVAPLTFNDIKTGQIITGKIRKVEDFGVFIVIDGSKNVSGLCHQSEMAEKRVHDVKKLYDEGDTVKAMVIKMDEEKQRISFGLKASYFDHGAESEDDSEDDGDSMQGVSIAPVGIDDGDDSQDNGDGNLVLNLGGKNGDAAKQDGDYDIDIDIAADDTGIAALNIKGFDWTADNMDSPEQSDAGSDDDLDQKQRYKKRRKAEIKIDRTGDLDAHGPQSVSDFERLLLGQPDSSALWTQYMAFQMQLSELSKARDVAERAIKMINIREDTEKMNIWIALLNLENVYGSDETAEEVFKRACQYNDAQEIHERLASIYIQSGKHEKADDLFQVIVKKFSQSPTVWYNYAHFLHVTLSSPDRARALLSRATQPLPPHTHLPLTLKFASLEFHSPNGSAERGRTIFEGLVSLHSKRLDIWNQLLDLEIQQGDNDIIRALFERVTKVQGLKPKGAKAWFRRWSEWEEKEGTAKSQGKVKAKAEEWVRARTAKGEDA